MEYLGHCIDTTGIHPTDKKLQAIQAAPVPTDASQLRAFIGLMNYYGKFMPHISTHLAPLYTLLEKERSWSWTEDCEASFRKGKTLLTNETVLVHYDNILPIKLACDASSYGVGAVLSHFFKDGERPIAFASRTLTKADRNHGQIEKEALALFFGVKKFHKYIYGRRFTLVTDHKPLLSILGSTAELPLIASARMQSGEFFFQRTSMMLNTREVHSMATLMVYQDHPYHYSWNKRKATDIFCVSFVDALPVTAAEIAAETTKDPILSQAYHYAMEGWPGQEVSEALKPLYQRREQLASDQGCLVWGMRVVVPTKLQ